MAYFLINVTLLGSDSFQSTCSCNAMPLLTVVLFIVILTVLSLSEILTLKSVGLNTDSSFKLRLSISAILNLSFKIVYNLPDEFFYFNVICE